MADRAYTPPQLAERWKCSPDRIRAMIVAGDLIAFNLAPAGQRPQYRITAEAVERFERARAVTAPPIATTTKRRRRVEQVESFV